MSAVTPHSLAKELRNIGPKSAKKLIDVGITSLDELTKVGAIDAYIRIYYNNAATPHAAYLYALEGAIRNCDWLAIPAAKKEEFKALTASLRNEENN